MLRFILIFFLSFPIISFSQEIQFKKLDLEEIIGKPKIYLVTSIDKTSNIANSCIKDELLINAIIEKVSDVLALELIRVETNFTSIFLENEIINLSPQSNDIIIFYYSGHGYRKSYQSSKFPYLAFNDSSKKELNLEQIHNTLISKNARLTITIGDLCNSQYSIPLPSFQSDEGNVENYKKLFIKCKGDILITSSKSGQASIATEYGSIFTKSFYNAFQSESTFKYGHTASWESIFKTSQNLTFVYSDKFQMPYYELNIINF